MAGNWTSACRIISGRRSKRRSGGLKATGRVGEGLSAVAGCVEINYEGCEMPDQLNGQEFSMLREEMEMLMAERSRLLKVAGAAAVLMANTDGRDLPVEAAEAAEMLSTLVNELPEDTLQEALESVHAEVLPGDTGTP